MLGSMKEIEEVKDNGYTMVSSFSGCGGSCLGYKAMGFNVLAAIEFIPEAAKTYKANFKDTYVYETDIRDITGKDILSRLGLKRGQLDVFEGSPPCSDFSTQRLSTSGTKKGKYKVYSETKQRVDDLFLEYARILGELSPKVFVAENTSNIVNQDEYMKQFINALENANEVGYNVAVEVLNFAEFGVPQSRKRAVFIGVRRDLGMATEFPLPTNKYVTTSEAIGDMVESVEDMKMTDLERKYCLLIPRGKGTEYISMLREKYGIKIMLFNHRRDLWDKPHTTLVHNTRPIHQLKNRWLTVEEGKRLCTFPDDFILTGNTNQQWERIGRAVPPLAAYYIAKCVKEEILDKVKKGG